MSLYQKYRPFTFDDVKGNSDLIQTLDGMLSKKETCPHTFLFHGESGTGKTTLARIVAHRLGCVGDDLREINASDVRGIDTIREIIKNSQYMPIEGDCRVWIVDECAKMTSDAQNAFLKILEDTPPHVYFLLCTTDPQKLISAIKGRCSIFQTKPLSDSQMFGLLRKVVKGENETLDKEVYDQIIQDSQGRSRNALQILEQVLNVDSERRLEIARQTALEVSQSIELCRVLIKGAPWSAVAKVLVGLKDQEAESVRRVVLGYCQSILLSGKDEPLCGLIMEEFLEPNFTNGFPQLVKSAYAVTKNK